MIRAIRGAIVCLSVMTLLSGNAFGQEQSAAAKRKQEREQKAKERKDKKEQTKRANQEKKKSEKKDKSDVGPATDSSGPREAVKSFRRTKRGDDEPTDEMKEKAEEGAPTEKTERKKRDDDSLIPGTPTEVERMTGDPTTTEEMWRILDRDMKFGLHKEAKRHLKMLQAQPDLSEKVLELREKYGSTMLVALTIDPELRKASKQLVDMANEQSQKKARDAERIKHFIDNLAKSPSEKGYAILQLRRAGGYAIPYFLSALADSKADRLAIIDGMLNMEAGAAPAVAMMLDSSDPGTVDLGVELLNHYGAKDSVPLLWNVAASPKIPQPIRKHAQETIARLLNIDLADLPASGPMLAKEAEKLYQHQSPVGAAGSNVDVWKWDGKAPKVSSMPATAAEEYWAERFAKQAVELDPGNLPARITLLSLMLDKNSEMAGVDRPLPETKNGVVETSLGVGADLLAVVLNKALDEGRTPVVLGAVKALGSTGRLTALTSNGVAPSPFARALNYPSRRVQFAAATSVLEMHPSEYFPYANRVVQTLIRAAEMDSKPAALVLSSNTVSGREKCSILTGAGFNAELAQSGRNGFDLAAQSAAFDLAIVDSDIQQWTLEQTIANFRNDARTAGLPIVVLFSEANRSRATALQKQYPKLIALPAGISAADFSKGVKLGLVDAGDRPLSETEKKQQQTVAVDWLQRLARGEFSFIDIKPAAATLTRLLGNAQFGPIAANSLSRIPSADIQSKLAGIVLAGTQPIPNRVASGLALAQNIQASSPGLDRATVGKLTDEFWKADDKNLRIALARVVGALGPSDNEVAKMVMKYRSLTPDDLRPEAPAPAAEKEAEEGDKPAKSPGKKDIDDEKPAAKKADDKKPAKKSKSFFDEN